METVTIPTIEWGVAAHTLPGQANSGDLHVVKVFQNGVLMAAVDGVGHGAEAATAAEKARTVIERHIEEPPIALFQRCHEELRSTRGVVMSVASINLPHGLMTWLGVGNVQGTLLRSGSLPLPLEETLLLRAGVVGASLPPLQAAVLPLTSGDSIVFATDGINDDFSRNPVRIYPPQRAAESIIARHGKSTDDALVLIGRFLGNRR